MSSYPADAVISPRGWWRRESLPERRSMDGVPDSQIAFWALIAFTFVLLLAPQMMVPGLAVIAFIRPAFTAAGVAAVSYLANRMVTHRPLTVVTRELVLALALIAWASATIPLSLWPGGSVAVIAGTFSKSLIVFWLIANVINTPERLRRFMIVLALAGAPLSLMTLVNYRAGLFIEGAVGVKRVTGYEAPLTHNPNDLALMLNLLLPLAIGLLLTRPRPLLRLVLVGTIVLEVTGIVITFSRAGFLALAVTTATWFWKFRRRRERVWVYAIFALGIACLPLLPSGYLHRLSTVTNISADRTGSAQARWEDTKAAIAYVADNPILGAGIGQDILALNEVRGLRWRSVHNVFLQYGVDLGLPGLILFALILFYCMKAALAVEGARFTEAGAELPALAAGVRVSLVAFLAAAFFHPAGYHFYFFYIAGLAVALRLIAGSIEPGPAPASGDSR